MSGDNMAEGQRLYAVGREKARDWFHRQWRIWPKRADSQLTTNISLHVGGVIAYRIENEGRDPPMSEQFRGCVDELAPNEATPPQD
jgi:hypothetical protein